MNHENSINIVLQGKGGVGKTFASWLLAQYLASKGSVAAFDLDPVNPTFTRFRAFRAGPVQLFKPDSSVNSKALDALIEVLAVTPAPCVLDTGASSFVPFYEYLRDNCILDILEAAGKRVVMHTLITAGAGFNDCLAGASSLLRELATPERRMVVWGNEFLGQISTAERKFEDFKLISDNHDRIQGVMMLCNRPAAFMNDLREVTAAHSTLGEWIEAPTTSLVPKKRLSMMRDDFFGKLDVVFGGSN